MSTVINFQNECEVPGRLDSLAAFRRWAWSDAFPERGRIDFVEGRIEVDMVPEEIFSHGVVKSEIATVLGIVIRATAAGYLGIDRTRITNVRARLSAEPDIVFVSKQSRAEGRVKFKRNKRGKCLEVVGSADLVVEILSDSSERKDMERLPRAYFRAGIREFWLVDARGDELVFLIHRRGAKSFAAVRSDAEGFQRSAVLGRRYRLDRKKDELGEWAYRLEEI